MILALALILVLALYGAARFAIGRLDRSRSLPTPSIPESLDPIDLAVLRSGRGDALRTAVVDLQSKRLVVIDGNLIARVPIEPAEPPGPIGAAILAALDQPKTFRDLARAVGPSLSTPIAAREAALEAQALILPKATRTLARLIAIAGAGGIVAIAAIAMSFLKHGSAMHAGAQFQFVLVVLGCLVGLVVWAKAMRVPRTSDRGRRFLERLVGGFPQATLRPYVVSPGEMEAAGAAPSGTGFAPATALLAAPLLVGLYGVAALDATPLATANTAMKPRRPDGSGGCSLPFSGGGSCGCCGGGSCSGGCSGGCGGGGCGGGGCGGG